MKIILNLLRKISVIKMASKKNLQVLGLIVLLTFFIPIAIYFMNKSISSEVVRIGYFEGGRVNMIYRTSINGFFDEEGVNVKLYTTDLRGKDLVELPDNHSDYVKLAESKLNFGKIRGTEIVDLMLDGSLDAGTIGEASFIQKVTEGAPIAAVALLGQDTLPGKGIIFRQDIKINTVDDFKGLTLVSRRAGPGDDIFLNEFINDIGLNEDDLNVIPQGDDLSATDWLEEKKLGDKLNIIYQVDEDYVEKWLIEGRIDGGLYHLAHIRRLVRNGHAYVYRPMDWIDSNLSHALLVFNSDFVKKHPDKVQKVVNAYVKRIRFEHSLPEEIKDESWDKNLMMKGVFQGMQIPQYTQIPVVNLALLNEMQNLLIEYDYVHDRVELEDYIDNSFVEKAKLPNRPSESLKVSSEDLSCKGCNVIFLNIGHLRADNIGLINPESKITPNVDDFFKNSIIFEQANSPSAATYFSATSIATGTETMINEHSSSSDFGGGRWKILDVLQQDGKYLIDYIPTIAEVLRNKGYYTISINDWIHTGKEVYLDRGFQEYIDFTVPHNLSSRLTTTVPIQEQVKMVNDALEKTDKLFFLYFHPNTLHFPYTYKNQSIDVKRGKTDNISLFREANQLLVMQVDSELGQLFDLLKEDNLVDNTIIVLYSNHGMGLGENRLGVGHPYQSSLHVPLLIRYPKIKTQVRIDAPISLVDLAPSLYEMLDVKIKHNVSGYSLIPLITNQIYQREFIMGKDLNFEFFRKGKWKIIMDKSENIELYNLDEDPHETNNVYLSNLEVVRELKEDMFGKKIEQIQLGEDMRTFFNLDSMPEFSLDINKIDFRYVILIGWDGTRVERLNKLLNEGKLPYFSKYFLQNGSCVTTMKADGGADTKPGWAEILTGYSPFKTGVFTYMFYRPIPQGYTIFERLEKAFGDENINTLFIASKVNNVGARGPHKICVNCLHRNITNLELKLLYWDEDSEHLTPRVQSEDFVLEQREGEPYYFTKDNIDVYINALGNSLNVRNKAFEYLDRYYNRPFFMFLHYGEPDEVGHVYGEDSEEYQEAIIQNDKRIEELVLELKQLGIFDKTILYLTTDHGMNKAQKWHNDFDSLGTFLCSTEKNLNEKAIKSDRKDVAPTILDRYGFDLEMVKPQLDGKSLLIK